MNEYTNWAKLLDSLAIGAGLTWYQARGTKPGIVIQENGKHVETLEAAGPKDAARWIQGWTRRAAWTQGKPAVKD